MNKALLIVDPQIDFITGSLPVPGAEKAMDELSAYILEHDGEYTCKLITADWHPYEHMSFVDNGGIWPTHCIAFSKGASIWGSILEAVNCTKGSVDILTKGTDVDTEEYSIFQNGESSRKLIHKIANEGIEQIDICGIAGDVCVLSTLTDGVKDIVDLKWHVLETFSPSLDGGEKLRKTIVDLSLK